MATFSALLAGVTDPHEAAVLKARIYCDPVGYGVEFVAPVVFKKQGWTVTVVGGLFLDLNDQTVAFNLRIQAPDNVEVPVDNPFQVFNPFYVDETGTENPTAAFLRIVTDAAHDACVRAGYSPPF